MRSETPVAAASNAEGALSSAWPRYASGVIAALLVSVMLVPLWWLSGEGATEAGLAPACVQWDDLARESIARRLQNGKRDVDLRQAGDAIFHLRRARRHCHAGWIRLACQDYLAVSRTAMSRPSRATECAMAGAEVAGAAQ